MREHWKTFALSAAVALFFGGGLVTWLRYFRPAPQLPEFSEQSLAYQTRLAEEQTAKVEKLRQKSPPFAYTLANECKTSWINFEGKRVVVKDKTGLSCGDICVWEPLGVFIPHTAHYYEAGVVKAYSGSEASPLIPSGCYPNVDGVCAVDTALVNVGDAVTFKGFGLGGDGTYAYSWSGDEGKSSATREFVTSFATTGRKAMTVRVTSNGQNIFKTCEVIVR